MARYNRMYNPTSPDDWDVEAALQDAVKNQTLLNQSYEDQTRNVIEEAAPAAAQSICGLALYSTNERIRLDAAKYVCDRVLGRIGDEKQSGATAPLEALLADVVQTAETLANGGRL